MKQITEIDDPRLVKALAHPLRISIMRILSDRKASPNEIATELDAPLGNVSYHVRYLERAGVLRLVGTRPRRGAVEHYYRAVGKLQITDRAWAEVPAIVKDAMVAASFAQAVQYARTAAAAGGFERSNAHLSRRPMVLDTKGFSELADEVKSLLDRAATIASESARRLAEANHSKTEVQTGLVLMLFEAAPAGAEVPAPDDDKHAPRRNRTRAKRHAATPDRG